MTELTEQDDLAQSLDGDGDAYARVVGRYQAQVARRMWWFAQQPIIVEELVQEVFIEAYYSLPKYRATGPFGGWLACIATRVGYRHWKKQRLRREVPREEMWWQELQAQPLDTLDPTRASRVVHALLEQLPPRDRLVLLLIYVEGRSVDEAAQMAGWSKTMVKVQAFRARNKLRALFAERGIDSLEMALDWQGDVTRERT